MTRQEMLYNYLIRKGNTWTSLKEIVDELPVLYPIEKKCTFHDSNARRWVTGDIQSINASPEYEKIIIHGNRGVKLATKEEAQQYIRKQFRSAFGQLKRVRILCEKAEIDEQMRMAGDPVESFLKGDTA